MNPSNRHVLILSQMFILEQSSVLGKESTLHVLYIGWSIKATGCL